MSWRTPPTPILPQPCVHPHHNPPMHLYVAPGKTHKHTCPGCKAVTIINGSKPRYF